VSVVVIAVVTVAAEVAVAAEEASEDQCSHVEEDTLHMVVVAEEEVLEDILDLLLQEDVTPDLHQEDMREMREVMTDMIDMKEDHNTVQEDVVQVHVWVVLLLAERLIQVIAEAQPTTEDIPVLQDHLQEAMDAVVVLLQCKI